MSKTLVLLVALMSVGCANAQLTELRISTAFTEQQQEAIIAAADAWCEADSRLCVPVVISDDVEHGNSIFIGWPKKKERAKHAAVTSISPLHRPKIYVPPDMQQSPRLETIVMHELGHALSGTGHHLCRGNVMYSHITAETYRLTRADVDMVSSHRRD